MKLIIKSIAVFIFMFLFFVPMRVEARSGCCSHHGGVCGCGCCDGTGLSSTCAPYYPECNGGSAPMVQQVVTQPTAIPTKRPVTTRVPTKVPTRILTATNTPTPTVTPTNIPTKQETPTTEVVESAAKQDVVPVVQTQTPKPNAIARFFNWLFGRK